VSTRGQATKVRARVKRKREIKIMIIKIKIKALLAMLRPPNNSSLDEFRQGRVSRNYLTVPFFSVFFCTQRTYSTPAPFLALSQSLTCPPQGYIPLRSDAPHSIYYLYVTRTPLCWTLAILSFPTERVLIHTFSTLHILQKPACSNMSLSYTVSF
jgi:hypothetical protein